MNIGNVNLDNRVFLAPMAGVTDLPFRLICKQKGCGMLYSEMINAKALCYNDENTKKMTKIEDEEHPIAIQIFGSDPEYMGRATEILNSHSNEILDINMGCPAPKVVKNGDGSALMRNPKLAEEVMKAVVKNSTKPVTLKIRKGWDDDNINAVEIAKIAEQSGISAVTIHGRTREQYYSGKADWDIIRQVKEAVSIPVIGNGDLLSAADVIKMQEQTDCDGFMIARGAQGNPWIFKQILHYFQTGEQLDKPSFEDVSQMILRHAKMMIEFKGEFTGIHEMRKHTAWYTAGYPHSSHLRAAVNTIENYEQLETLLGNYGTKR